MLGWCLLDQKGAQFVHHGSMDAARAAVVAALAGLADKTSAQVVLLLLHCMQQQQTMCQACLAVDTFTMTCCWSASGHHSTSALDGQCTMWCSTCALSPPRLAQHNHLV